MELFDGAFVLRGHLSHLTMYWGTTVRGRTSREANVQHSVQTTVAWNESVSTAARPDVLEYSSLRTPVGKLQISPGGCQLS